MNNNSGKPDFGSRVYANKSNGSGVYESRAMLQENNNYNNYNNYQREAV